MMKLYLIFIVFFILSSCVSVPPGTGGTYFYNDFSSPHILFNIPQGEEVGSTEGACYLSLVCIGDTRVSTAAKNSGIKTVSAVEYRFQSILFFYSKTTLIVYGSK